MAWWSAWGYDPTTTTMNAPATNNVPPALPPQKQGMGTGAKIAIGCGVVVIALVLLCGIGSFASYKWVMDKVEGFEKDFAAKNMVAGEVGQQLIIDTAPTVPTYYKGQVVKLAFTQPVTVEIGVIAQIIMVEKGQFAENVYFRGQVVSLDSGTQFAKEVNVECQVVEDHGATIAGGVTGSYMAKQ